MSRQRLADALKIISYHNENILLKTWILWKRLAAFIWPCKIKTNTIKYPLLWVVCTLLIFYTFLDVNKVMVDIVFSHGRIGWYSPNVFFVAILWITKENVCLKYYWYSSWRQCKRQSLYLTFSQISHSTDDPGWRELRFTDSCDISVLM